ncbi:hypothetical protein SERLADRAFT_397689 [Serpula lacrymans var. lacrymans S7.9]|uniref:Uncharacterized protein n=1 Tax=Serpula lacrymans var. lacrymans (strain S7.9) TaxID=578457 RepID=F8P5Z0_SERL9|nr:uncharacterized protein SERLADRAFT_397689 [Serpula lacrymans var. lacrymans S7.9]EGO22027.1 hypothetical protein SERLADRAFT_397689 [Serpula lacrymans var. lacrymans S7.9]
MDRPNSRMNHLLVTVQNLLDPGSSQLYLRTRPWLEAKSGHACYTSSVCPGRYPHNLPPFTTEGVPFTSTHGGSPGGMFAAHADEGRKKEDRCARSDTKSSCSDIGDS